MKIIETENLTKKYKRYKKQEGLTGSIKGLFHREYEEKIAVDDFDIHVNEGEFVGLIGPNGAGKTTLVKMLTGIIAPTSGKIQVMGFYPNKLENAFKQQYAVVMGQKSQLFFELTAEDTLRLFKEIYRIPEDEYKRNKAFFVDLFQVQELMNVQVRTLSLGERMKMELIASLLHNPKILFLDEPTIGLDAVAGKQIRTFLKDVNESRGTTILLTSHYMEDIKVLCKRSIVVNHGRKIYDGDTALLFERYQKSKRMTICFAHSVEPYVPEYCRVLEKANDKLVFEIPKQNAEKVLEFYIGHYPIRDIGIEEEEIGSVVERIYKGGIDMKKYLEIAKVYMKAQLIWRSDTFVDVILAVAKILFAWILWGILFEGKKQIAGLGFQTMISYYMISSYLFQLEKSAEISQQMTSMLRNGTFSKYMVIPVQTQEYFVAMEAGKIAFSAGIGFFATVLWSYLFRIPFVQTSDLKILLCGIIMVILGLLFMALLNYFLGILTLKFEEISTFLMIKDNFSAFVTGAVIPLALLPEELTAGMRFLPFYYVTYLPSMLFIGKCEEEAIKGLFVLSVWCIVFLVLNQVTYEHYRIKYDGAGI